MSKKLSLPLDFDEALSGLLKVKPPEKPEKPARKAAMKRKAKKR